MAYATLDQLVSLFGADEIRTLSDRQGTGELDEAVISDALERASSEVDSYLADRYATPLSGSDPIPPVVVSVTGDIARYRLTGGDIRDTDPIRERYTKALNWLRDVADGKAGIPGLPPAGTETPGAVLLEPGTRPEVEDAILELLQPLRETPGAKTVAAFQGQPDKDTWARLRRGFPAVLVLYAGSPAFTPSGRRLEERMEFEVYVMDKSYRSAANGQKPEPGHPGTYALLAAARERLLGVPPLPGMGPCLPSSIQGFVLDGASVYRMTVSTIHNIAL